jgi:predicted outer membrane repeat protein
MWLRMPRRQEASSRHQAESPRREGIVFHSFRLRLGLCAIVAVAAAAILPGATSAAVLTVCTAGPPTCQFATVSGALAASADGDVILIGPGSFAGGITVTTDVSLVGSGPSSTEILGGGTGVTVAGGADVIIRKLTITGATGTGLVNDGTLVVRHSGISDNGSASPDQGGILNTGTLTLNDVAVSNNDGFDVGALENHGSAVIVGSSLADNSAAFNAGAILNFGDVVFRDGTLSHNGSQGAGSWNMAGSMTIIDSFVNGDSGGNNFGAIANGAFSSGAASLVVRGTTFTGGGAFTGAAIANLAAGTASVSDSLVAFNNARSGGGIYSEGSLTLVNTDVVFNTANSGGGIDMAAGSLVIRDSSITNNETNGFNGFGGGVEVEQGNAMIVRTDVSSNTADNGGGIANRPAGNLTLRFDTINFNTAVTGGGVLNEGTITRVGTTFTGNVGGDCVGC